MRVHGARSSAISGVFGRRAGLDRMAAHLGGEGMRRVDHMRDALLPDVVGKSRRAAKAADPGRQRVAERNLRAAGIGIDRVDARARERRGERGWHRLFRPG